MNEQNFLNSVLRPNAWKGKYDVGWCTNCECAYIKCQLCLCTSCGSGGCDLCKDDVIEFQTKTKHRVGQYLTDAERDVYEKCLEIRKYIIESLNENQFEISWKDLDKRGELSQVNRKFFIKDDGK